MPLRQEAISRPRRSSLLAARAALLALAWLWAGPVRAQTPPTELAQQLDAVEVTGTRLRRTDTETPSPVQVITREEIERSGAASLTEVMRRLPASGFGTTSENDLHSRGTGTVSLRGLGASATLVLINGRRLAPYGFEDPFGTGTFVDLNQIPLSIVERIEVLLDGGSAIYGSDAVAGVVNIILRSSYRGAEVAAAYGESTHGDAIQRQASVVLGSGDLAADGYNVFASLSHLDQDPVMNTQRWHSRSADYRGFGLTDMRSTYSDPGNLYTADNKTFLQALPGCRTAIGEPTAVNPGRCLYDFVREIVPESKRDALVVVGTAALPNGFELFGDALVGHTVLHGRHVNFGTASYPATSDPTSTGRFLLPVGHPQNPYPFEVTIRTRFDDVQRMYSPVTDTERVVAGVRHHDLAGWEVESALLWARSKTVVTTQGVPDEVVLHSEVFDATGRAIGNFRFGDPAANDPALMARLYPTLTDHGTATTTSVDVRGTRPIFQLPGGAAQLAIGAELRRETYSEAIDPRITSGEISVLFDGTPAAGNRTIGSAYAELALPVAATVETLLAARYDHYSDFGGTTNTKAGIKWKAAPGLAFRATYSTAFRAPSPVETGAPATRFALSDIQDPKLCPVPNPANPNCDERVPAVTGGNPALQPERATSMTLGTIVEPWPGTSFTVDGFRVHRRDQITGVDPQYLLAHEGQFPGTVVRNADGTLALIDETSQNIGKVVVWGVDATAKARAQLGDFGLLRIDGTYSWLPHYWQTPAPGAPLADYAGFYLSPKQRAVLSFSLDRGPWRSSLTFNYTGKYLTAPSPANMTCVYAASGHPELCTVKAWQTIDLFLGYSGFQHLELGFLVTNLDNVQAPFDANQVANTFLAYYPAYHSAVGRFFKLTAKYSFQ
jgi:iron complex outermembrane receptor protein